MGSSHHLHLFNHSTSLTSSINASIYSTSTSTIPPKQRLGLNATLINKRKASANSYPALEDLSNTNNNNNCLGTDNSRIGSGFPPLSPATINTNFNSSIINNGSSPNSNKENGGGGAGTGVYSPKEYVESLHQNNRSQIIYGKNHVTVFQRGTEFAGYLSLHLNHYNSLILKWTPNQLMNVTNAPSYDENSSNNNNSSNSQANLNKNNKG
jgi:hypothetical protein